MNIYKGMTLIEVVLYATLLSLLMSGFISYAYAIHIQDFKLFDEIQSAQNP